MLNPLKKPKNLILNKGQIEKQPLEGLDQFYGQWYQPVAAELCTGRKVINLHRCLDVPEGRD